MERTPRDFLKKHAISQQEIDTVWTDIALHTTPGIPWQSSWLYEGSFL